MRPSTAPTGRFAPSSARISASVPATGAGTSNVTLSVSSSTTGSSTATLSPGRFSHFATVASVTDSPRLGTLISAVIRLSRKSVRDQLRLFLDMAFEQTGGRRGGVRPSGKAWPLGSDIEPGEYLFDAPVNKVPPTHVLRLFLAPNDLGIAVPRQDFAEGVGRKRIKLFDPHHRHPVVAARGPRLDQIEIDLAAAQDHAANRIIRGDRPDFRDHPAKGAARPHLVEPRHHFLSAQQRFRGENHQRLSEIAADLAPQGVKVVGGAGQVAYLDVILGAKLQVALDPGRGMLGPLPLIAVRQQQDEAAHAQPFRFAGT